jgi:alpha-glucosidase
MTTAKSQWWQTTTIYQIYPRSFQDANGDGVGDLKGIIERIQYLKQLGIGAVWLSPFFPSPMKDFGYDISDYCAVDPLFGRMADFDELLDALHANGLKLILDFVPNHTSDQHPWFQESRSSRESARRGWYIWRDAQSDGGPPNNWMSEFGGDAWTLDEQTGQYYYHAFLPEQPDLNWRNWEVRAAMYDAMRFWLRKGVDGFRVDVMWHLMKDELFRDNPTNPNYTPSCPPHERVLPVYSSDVVDVHEVVREMRGVVDEFDGRVLIGEIYLPFDRLAAYYGKGLGGAHLPFNFSLLNKEWEAAKVANLVHSYEASLPHGAWPNWVLSNHDRPRVATRVGRKQTKIAAMLLLTLRGTPTLYYGDELGMEQVSISSDRVRDPFELRVPGRGVGRDGARTPMQWSSDPHAGFSKSEPWLPLSVDWRENNVARLVDRGDSLLRFYQRLLGMRRCSPVLQAGDYREIVADSDVLLFVRELAEEWLMVALNFSDAEVKLRTPRNGFILFDTHAGEHREITDNVVLAPNQGILVSPHNTLISVEDDLSMLSFSSRI